MASENHFENYKFQTWIKHEILRKYLESFYTVLAGNNQNLVYVDGFAGAGAYGSGKEQQDGSPLIALRMFAEKPRFGDKVSAVFIEDDHRRFEELDRRVRELHAKHPSLREPEVVHGAFAMSLMQRIAEVTTAGSRLAPGFLFVDPCGVEGVSFEAISTFLAEPSSEALIFFNLDGVRRIAGLPKIGGTLPEVFGSLERVERLRIVLADTQTAQEREVVIVNEYLKLLKSTPAKFVTIFRVEYETRRATSHYLIHATSHRLGFRIMKDVMWGLGNTRDGAGAFALEQASLSDQLALVNNRDAAARKLIKRELKAGARQVKHFRDVVEKVDCLIAERHIKEVLKKMEEEGLVEVLDKDTGTRVVPAKSRKKHHGQTTLGDDYYVRLTPRLG